MGTPKTINGQPFTIPALGESGWGTQVTGFLIAVADGTLQKTGGAFTLTADVDFGPNNGLKSVYYTSRGTTSTTGVIRLGNSENIGWRNAANSSNLSLTVDSLDRLTFNGFVIGSGAALTANRAVVTDAAGILVASAVTSTEVGYLIGASSSIQTQLATGSSNLTTHAALTIAHGATGAVVGTTNTQALTNKTISSTALLTGALTLPAGSVAQRPTPTAGMTRLNTDSNSFEGYANGIWSSIGGGLNEQPVKNYLKIYAEANVAPGTVSVAAAGANIAISGGTSAFYADAGAAAITSDPSTLLRGANNYLTAVTSFSATGSVYVQLPAMTLETADAGKPQSIIFDTTGNTTDGDWDVVVANYTSAGVFVGLIPVAGNASACSSTASAKLPTGTAQFNGFFIPTSTAGDTFALRFRRLAGSVQVRIDSLFVGNIPVRVGAPVTDWQSYTPTGNLTTNTSYTGKWRRAGDTLEGQITTTFAGANTQGLLGFTDAQILNGLGLTVDTSKLPVGATSPRHSCGTWLGLDAGINGNFCGGVQRSGAGDWELVYPSSSTSANQFNTNISTPFIISLNDCVSISFKVPIANWSSNTQMADRALEEYASNSSTSVSTDSTSFAYGSAGSVIPQGTAATLFDKTVQFQTPIQATDLLILEIYSGNGWAALTALNSDIDIQPYSRQNTAFYGIYCQQITSNTARVRFGQYRNTNGATFGAAGLDWGTSTIRYRVRKVSSGAQIGGAISTSNIVGRTDGSTVGSGYIGQNIRVTGTGAISIGTGVRGVGTLPIPSAGVWLLNSTCHAVWSATPGTVAHELSSVSASSTSMPEVPGVPVEGIGTVASTGAANTVTNTPTAVATFTAAGTVFLNAFTTNNVSAASTNWFITAIRIA